MYIAIAVLVLHFFVAPIYVIARCDIDTDSEYSCASVKLFALYIVCVRIYLDRLLDKLLKRGDRPRDVTQKTQEAQEDKSRSGGKNFVASFAVQCLKRTVISHAELDCAVGTGDAAIDALFCGGAEIASEKLIKAFGIKHAHVEIKPDYGATRVRAYFFGIFCFNIANIIVAAALAALGAVGKRREHAVIFRRAQ